jgi:hypothetical protein
MRESRVSWGTQTPVRVPQALFGDGPLEVTLGRGVLPLEGGGAVLEELLLPEVEQRGGELMLVAEIRDRYVVDQVTPQDGDLLDRRIVLSGLSHDETPTEL